jgi:hypothetical protein
MRIVHAAGILASFALATTMADARAQSGTFAATPTFHKDVLPIFQQNCQSCHRPGQIGPMPLLDYTSTRPWARAIKQKVVARQMPPWFADPNVGHGFANDRSLDAAEIETIVKWVDGGAPAGDPNDAPPPITWPDGGWLIPPDVVVKGAPFTVPRTGVMDWMYITMPMGFREDTWVTSMEMRPGVNPRVTHHYCVFVVAHKEGVTYGVPVLGTQAEGTGGAPFEACYEPGQQAFDYRPQQAARLIPANSDIIFQMHYNPVGQEIVDQPQIGFTVTTQRPARQYTFQRIGSGSRLNIPPYAANYIAPTQEGELAMDAEIIWMQGHAHYRAKEMTFSVEHPDGRLETPLRLRWHPFWQLLYYPATPIVAKKGTVLRIDGRYDNSGANPFNPDPSAVVRFGEQAKDEMLFPTFGLLVDGSIDLKTTPVIRPTPRVDRTYTVVDTSSSQ